MKTFIALFITLAVGIAFGYWLQRSHQSSGMPAITRLEEILSIKELHLVKHHYHDLFFLHRKNNPDKSIRAIIQVPVTIVSYIDLKKIQVVRHNDTIRQVILPRALVHPPSYELNKMSIRKTRSFQVHAGQDLYPEVSRYLMETLTHRMDSIHHIAIENKIMEQAESEGKEYVEGLLRSIGRSDIQVIFVHTDSIPQVMKFQKNNSAGVKE